MGWQPIETVPESGEFIVTDGRTVTSGSRLFSGMIIVGDDEPFPATHWMPLPEPPGKLNLSMLLGCFPK